MDYIFVILIVIFVAFFGSFIQASSGFGYAIICMALLPLVIPFRTAAVIEIFTAFIMVFFIALKLRKHINFKIMMWPIIAAIIVSNLGIFTLMISSEAFLRRALGVSLIILCIYFIFWGAKIRFKPTVLNGLIAGATSGFFGGLLGIGGPPMAAYLLSVTDDKMEYNATLQCFFVFSNIYIFGTHIVLGNVSSNEINLGLAALIGLCIGIFFGSKVFKRLSMQHVRKFVYIFMAIAGVYLIIS